MDEAARKDSPAVSEQEQRSPEEIREDIEETRRELGDTAAELAGKTDVKSRAKAKVEDVRGTIGQKRDDLASRVSQAAPDNVSAGGSQVASVAKENPVPFALVGTFLAGIVIGRLLSR
jgi:ElaB/YqjD/DUF883 family membrane-anchored ribosome-binding protein